MSFIKQLTTITNTAALTAALSLTLAANANAQTVRNADEPGRNPSLEYVGGDSSSGYTFITNQTVQHYFNAGDVPRLDIFLPVVNFVGENYFTITGYLVKLP
jgi:hypothetical protein